jgi:hypothetical protein
MSAVSSTEVVQSCASCGASIYPEHLERGLAQRSAGKLLCKCCLEAEPEGSDPTALELPPLVMESSTPQPAAHPGDSGVMPAPDAPAPQPVTHRSSPGAAARHVRTFHARLSEGAVSNLDALVNDWLARHPDVEIKFANTTVGVWEGKHAEPNLILSIFY